MSKVIKNKKTNENQSTFINQYLKFDLKVCGITILALLILIPILMLIYSVLTA